MSLHELLRCEDHHQEVRVFSHLNFLPQELEGILGPGADPVAAHTVGLQRENMADVNTVRVEDIDTMGVLGQ